MGHLWRDRCRRSPRAMGDEGRSFAIPASASERHERSWKLAFGNGCPAKRLAMNTRKATHPSNQDDSLGPSLPSSPTIPPEMELAIETYLRIRDQYEPHVMHYWVKL